MARYVCLIRFTDQGVRAIKDSPARAAAFKRDAEKAGVSVETQLWTGGRYNGVLVLNGDETAVLRAVTQLVAQGNVRVETLRAFNADEVKAITAG